MQPLLHPGGDQTDDAVMPLDIEQAQPSGRSVSIELHALYGSGRLPVHAILE